MERVKIINMEEEEEEDEVVEEEKEVIFIPNSVFFEILLRISARTLIQFKFVSKQWCSIIKDPYFIHKHFDHVQTNQLFGIAESSILTRSLRVFERRRDDQEQKWDCVPDPDRNKCLMSMSAALIPNFKLRMMVACKGLLCIYGEDIQICNPTTKECVTLPIRPTLGGIDNSHQVAFGFGYSSITEQYKLVELTRDNHGGGKNFNIFILGGTSRSWRTLSLGKSNSNLLTHQLHDGPFDDAGMYVNDSIYWWSEVIINKKNILCFDIETERFRLIKSPDEYYPLETNVHYMFRSKRQKYSYVYRFRKLTNDGISFIRDHWGEAITIDIWKLKRDYLRTNEEEEEYVWIKEYNIDCSMFDFKRYSYLRLIPLCIKNQKLFLVDADGLFSYDLHNWKIEKIIDTMKEDHMYRFYEESLLSLRDMLKHQVPLLPRKKPPSNPPSTPARDFSAPKEDTVWEMVFDFVRCILSGSDDYDVFDDDDWDW